MTKTLRKATMKRSKLRNNFMSKEILKIGLNISANATFVQIF